MREDDDFETYSLDPTRYDSNGKRQHKLKPFDLLILSANHSEYASNSFCVHSHNSLARLSSPIFLSNFPLTPTGS